MNNSSFLNSTNASSEHSIIISLGGIQRAEGRVVGSG